MYLEFRLDDLTLTDPTNAIQPTRDNWANLDENCHQKIFTAGLYRVRSRSISGIPSRSAQSDSNSVRSILCLTEQEFLTTGGLLHRFKLPKAFTSKSTTQMYITNCKPEI
jgi:hypothetical protein